jgi:hypothetical protein
MTELAPLVAALRSSDTGTLPPLFWQLLAVVLLFSPNLVALAKHGTTDLLAAHGYTMEEWIEERRVG